MLRMSAASLVQSEAVSLLCIFLLPKRLENDWLKLVKNDDNAVSVSFIAAFTSSEMSKLSKFATSSAAFFCCSSTAFLISATLAVVVVEVVVEIVEVVVVDVVLVVLVLKEVVVVVVVVVV